MGCHEKEFQHVFSFVVTKTIYKNSLLNVTDNTTLKAFAGPLAKRLNINPRNLTEIYKKPLDERKYKFADMGNWTKPENFGLKQQYNELFLK